MTVEGVSHSIASQVAYFPMEQIDFEDHIVAALESCSADSVIFFATKKRVGKSVERPI